MIFNMVRFLCSVLFWAFYCFWWFFWWKSITARAWAWHFNQVKFPFSDNRIPISQSICWPYSLYDYNLWALWLLFFTVHKLEIRYLEESNLVLYWFCNMFMKYIKKIQTFSCSWQSSGIKFRYFLQVDALSLQTM